MDGNTNIQRGGSSEKVLDFRLDDPVSMSIGKWVEVLTFNEIVQTKKPLASGWMTRFRSRMTMDEDTNIQRRGLSEKVLDFGLDHPISISNGGWMEIAY